MKKLLLMMSIPILGITSTINAQSKPFVGEIAFVPYNFSPDGWLECKGQLLPITDNEVLFKLIGTTYGGDGQTTFALPDASGRVIVSQGTSPGLSPRTIGETYGEEAVTLKNSQIPDHQHTIIASSKPGDTSSPTNATLANTRKLDLEYDKESKDQTFNNYMNSNSVQPAGTINTQPHNNMMPFTTVKCIIALYGIDPTQ